MLYPVERQISPFRELFNIEISRLMTRYDTLNNVGGEEGKIHHPGNIAFIHAFS